MGSPAQPVTDLPVALTIAGSDSGGGAGIQADLKVFFVLGCHGTSAITALTAQNTVGVTGIHPVEPGFVRAQVEAVTSDFEVKAAKTGMLASSEIVEATAAAIEAAGIVQLVVDPVFVSKHGDALLEAAAVEALKTKLFPLATVITPNLHEAAALTGLVIETKADTLTAARALHAMGPQAVLIKGGHAESEETVDVLWDGTETFEVSGPRYDTRDTHGTGCALSAAIAARLAHGDDLRTAVVSAKEFIGGAIKHSLRLGRGFGPVNPGWRL